MKSRDLAYSKEEEQYSDGSIENDILSTLKSDNFEDKIEKYLRDGETAVVPGKLLSLGNLTKKAEIAAYQASQQTKEKIAKANAKFLTIPELMKKNPKGEKVRIIG